MILSWIIFICFGIYVMTKNKNMLKNISLSMIIIACLATYSIVLLSDSLNKVGLKTAYQNRKDNLKRLDELTSG